MKPSVRFGLLLGAILVALPLFVYVLGVDKNDTVQKVSGFFNVGITAGILFLGIKTTRDTIGNGFTSFGKAFSTGMVISLISSAISAIGTFLYFTVVNPGMITYIKLKQEEALYEKGMSDADVEKFSSSMEFMNNPAMMTGFGFLGMVILGLVVSLIWAGVLKKDNPSDMIS